MKKISQQVNVNFVAPSIKDILAITPLMDSLDDAVKKECGASIFIPAEYVKRVYEVLSECGFVTIEGTNYADYVKSMDNPENSNVVQLDEEA